MLDPIQALEDRVSELLEVLRETVRERDTLRTQMESLEADHEASVDSSPLAELEKQRVQALSVVEMALAELALNQSAAEGSRA